MDIQTKEIAVVKTQVSKAISAAESIEIKTDEQMLEAGEIKKKIKIVGKMVKEKKEAITKPLNDALKQVRELFKPLEEGYEQADDMIASKMIAYQRIIEEKQRKIEEEARKKLEEAQKQLEQGKLTEKQAERVENKIEKKLEEAPQVIKKSENFQTREIKKFRIINETEVPREYLMIDEVKVRKAMMAGIVVSGVEYYTDKIIV